MPSKATTCLADLIEVRPASLFATEGCEGREREGELEVKTKKMMKLGNKEATTVTKLLFLRVVFLFLLPLLVSSCLSFFLSSSPASFPLLTIIIIFTSFHASQNRDRREAKTENTCLNKVHLIHEM